MKVFLPTLLICGIFFSGCFSPEREAHKNPYGKSQIFIATTTSLYDSGLLDVLKQVFETKYGYKLKIMAVGSGEALKLGEKKVVDLLLTHTPELEKKFMAEGYGERREEFLYSEFAIAGPSSDPARIKGYPFIDAFVRIAESKSLFVSRADNSGTHEREKGIWKQSKMVPSGKWYIETGQGMGASLMIASEKGAYILADCPTFFQLKKKGKIKLEILAVDGQYRNVYSAISIKDETGIINREGANAFINFLISDEAQNLIENYDSSYRSFKSLKMKFNN